MNHTMKKDIDIVPTSHCLIFDHENETKPSCSNVFEPVMMMNQYHFMVQKQYIDLNHDIKYSMERITISRH